MWNLLSNDDFYLLNWMLILLHSIMLHRLVLNDTYKNTDVTMTDWLLSKLQCTNSELFLLERSSKLKQRLLIHDKLKAWNLLRRCMFRSINQFQTLLTLKELRSQYLATSFFWQLYRTTRDNFFKLSVYVNVNINLIVDLLLPNKQIINIKAQIIQIF